MSGEFNHVQFAIDEALSHGKNRESIDAFFMDVLGWQPFDTKDANTLAFTGFHRSQYLILKVDSEASQLNPEDHVGLSIDDFETFDAIHQAARAFSITDDRLTITEFDPVAKNGAKVQAFMLKYTLPFGIEIQHHQFEDDEPQHFFTRVLNA